MTYRSHALIAVSTAGDPLRNKVRELRWFREARPLVDARYVRAPRLRRRGRWLPSRRCKSDAYLHHLWRPGPRHLDYLKAYAACLASGRPPTLERIATQIGVRRQTVWQMEKQPAFRGWLIGQLRRDRPCSWHEWIDDYPDDRGVPCSRPARGER
jgi:hypothetical protein